MSCDEDATVLLVLELVLLLVVGIADVNTIAGDANRDIVSRKASEIFR